jgi:GxxExxY protein
MDHAFQIKQFYVAAFVCFGKITVEIKAVTTLANGHKGQILNYLAATGLSLGFFVNFCACPKAGIIRGIR